jgi:two-component system OmpR family response regulator
MPVKRDRAFIWRSRSRTTLPGMRILLVEDDAKLAALLHRSLSERGQATDVAACGEDARWLAGVHAYDVLVLDIMLPGMDGFELCRVLREDGVWAPVMMLTARDGIADRVKGLDAGADDYLVKPFSLAELLARLRALVRRSAAERPTVLSVDDLRLDPATHAVWRADVEVSLSSKEFALLELFMRRPDEVISRIELLEHGWDMAYDNRSNVITVYIRTLREKIDRPFGRTSLETVRGAGYRLRASREP